MVLLTTAAFVLGILPGTLLLRLPVGARDARARLPAEERWFWAVLLSVVWSVALTVLLAAVRAYTLERVLWITAGVSAVAIIGWRGRLSWHGAAARPTWSSLIPALLLGLGIWLFFPTAEYLIGGKDPGTYVNQGIRLAREGALLTTDPDVAAIPPELRELFFRGDRGVPDHRGVRFMGFVITDPDRGRVVGQFPQWVPASIALAYDVAGIPGALNAVALWALLGLVAVYFAGARLFGRAAAAIGTTLLAINVVEIWFARYPNAELTVQTMLFGAVLAFNRAVGTDRRFFGPVAAALVGLQLLLRFDTILAIGAFVAAALLLRVVRTPIGWGFGATLAALGIVGGYYLLVPLQVHTWWYAGFTAVEGGVPLAMAGLAAAGFTWLVRNERVAGYVQAWLPRSLAVLLAGLAVYAYFFREPGGRLALHDAHALRHFAWYITPLGLLAAVMALVVMMTRRFWRDPAFFTLVTVYAVFFFYKIRITNEHFWASRRALTVILPAALLLIGALATWVTSSDTWRQFRQWSAAPGPRATAVSTALAVLLVAPLGAAFWTQSQPVLRHREYAGVIAKIEMLAAQLQPRDLLLVESRDAGSDLHVFGLPLAYAFDRHVLVLRSDAPDKTKLDDLLDWAWARFDRVYALAGGGSDLLTRHFDAMPVRSEQFSVPEYDSPQNAYPTRIRQKQFDFGLYRLVPAADREVLAADLHVGILDDLNIINFFARERRGGDGLAFRWSKNRAHVIVPRPPAGAREVTIWMGNAGRPPQAPPAEVAVSVAGQPLGSVVVGNDIHPYRFLLPEGLGAELVANGAALRITLDVPTWNPAEVLGAPDSRDLGVMVTRVEVR